MNTKKFKTIDNIELIIRNEKSSIIFELDKDRKTYRILFNFTQETFKELFDYIESISIKTWKNINPKQTNSLSSDYYEYYDKELDNNGYLAIDENILNIERPSLNSTKLYEFNKRRMESFIYDFKKLIK